MLLETAEINNIPIENFIELLDEYLNNILSYTESIEE